MPQVTYVEQAASIVKGFDQCHLSMDMNATTLYLWSSMTQRAEWKAWKCGNNNSHACKYSIVYAPVHTCPHSTIKYSTISVT